MTLMPASVQRSIGPVAIAIVAAAAGAAVLGVMAVIVPSRTIQVITGLVFVGAAVVIDDEAHVIPRLLRPAPVLFGSLAIASVSMSLITSTEYEAYFTMWACQVGGFLLGILLLPHLGIRTRNGQTKVDLMTLDRYSKWAFMAFGVAALAYFKLQGVAVLSPDIEQSRVDAAQGTSGYIHVFAVLLPTAAIMLVATRGRRARPYVIVSVLFMIGVGNRIPLVYFAFPLVAMTAIVGQRIRSVHLLGVGLALVAIVAVFGAYRIMSQADLRRDPIYAPAANQNDYIGVGVAAVDHYAAVVPANAILVKHLMDEQAIPRQWGKTYGTLFLSALPGRQISPDMLIKEHGPHDFIGGGIPPTLAGEGYMNWGYAGIVINACALMLLMRYWASSVVQVARTRDPLQLRVTAVIYGYVVTWAVLAQISGFAGSATGTLASFLVLAGLRWAARSSAPRLA